MFKRITSLFLGISIILSVVIFPINVSASSEIFIDEYDTAMNPGIRKAFYSSNVYEATSVANYFGKSPHATRLVAENDGVIVYKHEDVSAICMRGCSNGRDGKDFIFYYSQDNENWTEMKPFYFQAVDTRTTYTGGDYYFVGFPSGTIYFKIVLPGMAGQYNYNRIITWTKIESGGITLLSSLDTSLRNQVEAMFEDDNEFMNKSEVLECDEEFRLLYHLNAIDSSFLEEEKLNAKITKGEFANALARLVDYPVEWLKNSSHTKFSDVSASNPYAAAITMMTDLGYMAGNADGSFRPDSHISVNDAIKAVVSALGYRKVLEKEGVITAAKLADLNFSFSDRMLTGEGAIKLLFAMLNAYSMKHWGDDYVRSDSIYMTDTLGLERREGQITNTIYGSILSESSVEKDTIKVDAGTYAVSSSYLDNKLGKRIYFYLDLNSKDNEIISYGSQNVNNEEITLEYEDIEISSCKDNKIVYQDEKGKERNIRIKNEILVVNGGRVVSFDLYDIINNDFITLYDNNDDGVYETIIAEKYEEIWVKDIYSEEKLIIGYYGGKTFKFDEDDYTHINYVKDGNVAMFSQIAENDILSIAQSADNEYLKIIINRNQFEGSVLKVSGDGKIFINGEEYECSRTYEQNIGFGYAEDIKVGSNGTYYLNAFGKIAAYLSDILPKRYAYLSDTRVEDVFESTLWLKVFDEAGEWLELECRPMVYVEYQGTAVSLNGRAAYDKLASYENMINVETGRVEGLIQYETDKNGKVHTICVPSNLASKEYFSLTHKNASAYTDGTDLIAKSYRYDENSIFFAVPNDRNDYEEYKTKITLASGIPHNVTLYDVNDDRIARVVLVNLSEHDGDNRWLEGSTLSFVSGLITEWDEKERKGRTAVTIIENGVEKKYFARDNLKLRLGNKGSDAATLSSLTIEDLKIGDCVQYALDENGNICKMTVLFQNDTDTFYLSDGTPKQTYARQHSSDYYILYAKVVSCKNPYLLLETDEGLAFYKIGEAKIATYRDEYDKVSNGFASDILPDDYVVFRSTNTKVNTLLVLKD